MNRKFESYTAVALIAFVFSQTSSAAQESHAMKPASSPSATRSHQLHALFDEHWQYVLSVSPGLATALGDNRYNDRLSDYSPEFIQRDLEQTRKFLARFEAINTVGLSQQDQLSRELMIRELREQIEGAQFKRWEMPVSPRDGPQTELPDLITFTPFNNAKDYENYLSRLRQIPRVIEQVTANMLHGMRDRLMPPRYLIEKVVPEAEDVASQAGENSPFFKPLKNFPSAVPEVDQKSLRTQALAIVDQQIIPAYQKFAVFIRDEYLPHGRTEPGVWALPDGEARYRYAIRRLTTTDLTPDQIHEIGLRELHQTEAEMLAVAYKFGFNDLATFNQHIKDDRNLYANSGQQLLDLYQKYVDEMKPELPKLFGRLPKAGLVAVPMEAVRAKNGVCPRIT